MTININRMLDSYIECALWSTTEWESGETFDNIDASPSNKCLKIFRQECEQFLEEIQPILDTLDTHQLNTLPLSAEQIGHDFWLTRNGHGAGFWDRGMGELGEKLTTVAKSYGTCDLYLSDSNQIEVM